MVRLLPDVVLLDLAMPGKGGLDVIPELKAAHPEVKIVVLTLFSPGGYRQAALDAGADAFDAIHGGGPSPGDPWGCARGRRAQPLAPLGIV